MMIAALQEEKKCCENSGQVELKGLQGKKSGKKNSCFIKIKKRDFPFDHKLEEIKSFNENLIFAR